MVSIDLCAVAVMPPDHFSTSCESGNDVRTDRRRCWLPTHANGPTLSLRDTLHSVSHGTISWARKLDAGIWPHTPDRHELANCPRHEVSVVGGQHVGQGHLDWLSLSLMHRDHETKVEVGVKLIVHRDHVSSSVSDEGLVWLVWLVWLFWPRRCREVVSYSHRSFQCQCQDNRPRPYGLWIIRIVAK